MKKTTPLEAVISGLANVARVLASRHWQRLEQLKSEYKQISRPDFLWHYLLQSFATMGGLLWLVRNNRGQAELSNAAV